jgi:hypothetical protein
MWRLSCPFTPWGCASAVTRNPLNVNVIVNTWAVQEFLLVLGLALRILCTKYIKLTHNVEVLPVLSYNSYPNVYQRIQSKLVLDLTSHFVRQI